MINRNHRSIIASLTAAIASNIREAEAAATRVLTGAALPTDRARIERGARSAEMVLRHIETAGAL